MPPQKKTEKPISVKTATHHSAGQENREKGGAAKFNPLALDTLAESMVAEFLKQTPVRLDSLEKYEGPG